MKVKFFFLSLFAQTFFYELLEKSVTLFFTTISIAFANKIIEMIFAKLKLFYNASYNYVMRRSGQFSKKQ